VVRLKNGNELLGEVIREDDKRLTLKFEGGVIQIPQRRIESVKKESRLDYLIELGQAQMNRSSFEAALETFRQARAEGPRSQRAGEGLLEAQRALGKELVRLKRYHEARDVLVDLVQGVPNDSEARTQIRAIDSLLARARKDGRSAVQELKGGKLDRGLRKLHTLYNDFPDFREEFAAPLARAYGLKGDQLLVASRLQEAEAAYARAISIDPELVPAVRQQYAVIKVKKIQALLDANDFVALEQETEQGIEVAPGHPTLRFYHALALEGRGKTRRAAEEYLDLAEVKRPLDLESAVGALRRAAEAKLLEAGAVNPTAHPKSREAVAGAFRTFKTAHFELHHRNGVVAREIAAVAEQHYGRLFRSLRCPTHLIAKIQIFVFATKKEYLEASGMAAWSGGAHRLAARRGSFSKHEIYCHQDQPRLLTGILPHEIAHALLAHRMAYEGSLPLWTNEGFAVLSEPSHVHRYYMRILKQERARRKLIPVEKVVASGSYPDTNVELFYAQSFGLVAFLVDQKGLDTYVRFLLALSADNGALRSLLQKHYGVASLETLQNRWVGWLDYWRAG